VVPFDESLVLLAGDDPPPLDRKAALERAGQRSAAAAAKRPNPIATGADEDASGYGRDNDLHRDRDFNGEIDSDPDGPTTARSNGCSYRQHLRGR
jgi:hypothetical protein